MLDPAIAAFFSERKEGWLKKKLKPDMTDVEVQEAELECEALFSLENWLADAAKRAGQMSISTHPCTFSHPSSRKNKNGYVTSIIADNPKKVDGYLRSGNVSADIDALGNAAALDVYKFLSIITEDGKTVLEHIQQDSELGQALLDIPTENYVNLKAGFLAIASSDEAMVTSSKIKQIYFPVDSDYHQLSVLSNSGIIYELRKRIDALRFSDNVKAGREQRRNNAYSDSGYSEIYNITTIGYGGTKPQNVSVLNNQYGGKAHLLSSVPPVLEQRDIKFPSKDFFKQSLRYYDFRESLQKLDNVLKIERDGQIPLEKIRKGRDRCLGDILDIILQKMMVLREVSTQQFRLKTTQLPEWQQIWLSEQYKDKRLSDDDWLDKACNQLSHWITDEAYKNYVKNPVLLGHAERAFVREFVNSNREVLR